MTAERTWPASRGIIPGETELKRARSFQRGRRGRARLERDISTSKDKKKKIKKRGVADARAPEDSMRDPCESPRKENKLKFGNKKRNNSLLHTFSL